jgi:hypothetical protein
MQEEGTVWEAWQTIMMPFTALASSSNVVLMDSGLSPARLQNLMGFPAATVRDSKSKSKAPALQEAPGMHFIGNPNRSSEHHRERDGVTHA